MIKVLRIVAGCLAGVAVAFALVILVEIFNAAVYPPPEDFDGSMAAMCAYVESTPAWVLAAVVPMWGGTALVSTWLAGRIGGFVSAVVVGGLLLAALGLNIAMVPYPAWFEIVIVVVCAVAVMMVVRRSGRGRRAAAPAEIAEA